MENKTIYITREDTKLVGIGGLLIIIASWNITMPLNILANLGRLSQMKFALVLLGDFSVPDVYFEVTKIGYLIWLPISLIMIFAFFKKMKIYKYLEIVNVTLRVIFLSIHFYILKDLEIIFTPLADNLFISTIFSLGIVIFLFASKRVKNTFIN